ncbi:MAG: DUF5113 domain-containing protein [Bacteroidaceae bacterium]
MKKRKQFTYGILLLMGLTNLLTLFSSCGEVASSYEIALIDSLNTLSYSYRYKSIEIASNKAKAAYEAAHYYNKGKAEACNLLAYYSFLQMDYETAEQCYTEAAATTTNELEKLIADIGLMQLYQQIGRNKLYYDYRNVAKKRMDRINEDRSVFMDAHSKERLHIAMRNFIFVSADYYHQLQQREKALISIAPIGLHRYLMADMDGKIYYNYLLGKNALFFADNPSRRAMLRFDYLFKAHQMSAEMDYYYMQAQSLLQIALLINSSVYTQQLLTKRAIQLAELVPGESSSSTPYRLAKRAMELLKLYDSHYPKAFPYTVLANTLNRDGDYTAALDTLEVALETINKHHACFYLQGDATSLLRTDAPSDTVYTELKWISNPQVKTYPACMAAIREELSVSYAGLFMKPESDYNRNVYLDILDYTRQDREWEGRYESLQRESDQLSLFLLLVIVSIVLLVLILGWFARRWRKKNSDNIVRLQSILMACKKTITAIPATADTTAGMMEGLLVAVFPNLKELFAVSCCQLSFVVRGEEEMEQVTYPLHAEIGGKTVTDFYLYTPEQKGEIGCLKLYTEGPLNRVDRALASVVLPYISWIMVNGSTLLQLGDEQRIIEEQFYISQQHISTSKQKNIDKKACMSIVMGIHPLIDRIYHEVTKVRPGITKLSKPVIQEKYAYMEELIDQINTYNDILAVWIKMKQGSVDLHIDSFALQELFKVATKSGRTFALKQQTLKVEPTTAMVKADKALTLFMINTLLENARKYTPNGGLVTLSATTTADYVEIAIEDNGIGLSAADRESIVSGKMYDAKRIGVLEAADKETLLLNKGSGFGLLNCRDIIQKYQKSSALFAVTRFDVTSTLGKGSRFFFRLPKGVSKLVLVLSLLFSFSSCQLTSLKEQESKTVWKADSVYREEARANLERRNITQYADSAYYCNIEGRYTAALAFVDTGLQLLNAHCKLYTNYTLPMLQLTSGNQIAELTWYETNFPTNYPLILDLRNEAAVASLALHRWELYTYNNEVYTALYKLVSEDKSLETYCKYIRNTSSNKLVAISFFILLFFLLIVAYYIYQYRWQFANRLRLEQVLDVNQQIFTSSLTTSQVPNEWMHIPQQLVDEVFESFNEIITIDAICISIKRGVDGGLKHAANPRGFEKQWIKEIEQCYTEQKMVYANASHVLCLPLLIDGEQRKECIGVLTLNQLDTTEEENSALFSDLIARFMAVVLYRSVIKIDSQYDSIELARDEERRISWEDELIHVQNMILDNSLSSIKHETIYYPNRMKQLIHQLQSNTEQQDELTDTLYDVVSYYKEVLMLLSLRANRQLEKVYFKREHCEVNALVNYVQSRFEKRKKKQQIELLLTINKNTDGYVLGDEILIHYLLDNLLQEAFLYKKAGCLELTITKEEGFIRFSFTDKRREKTEKEVRNLFYPQYALLTTDKGERLLGIEFLICKQIIRDHDEYCGQRGCRINAEIAPHGGYTIFFTLPITTK